MSIIRTLPHVEIEPLTRNSQAHFAILRTLLSASPPFITIRHTLSPPNLTVRVNRNLILTSGKPALGALLLRLHIYRCTADVAACRKFYEDLTTVDGVYKEWRETVLKVKRPRQILVQANTFLGENGEVTLREYDATVQGMVRSWAEREV